jgi:hypothetical protein
MSKKSVHWFENTQDLKNVDDVLHVDELILAYDSVAAGILSKQFQNHENIKKICKKRFF